MSNNPVTCQEWHDWPEEEDEVPCVDKTGHVWVVSDENENVCYCEKCGSMEY